MKEDIKSHKPGSTCRKDNIIVKPKLVTLDAQQFKWEELFDKAQLVLLFNKLYGSRSYF